MQIIALLVAVTAVLVCVAVPLTKWLRRPHQLHFKTYMDTTVALRVYPADRLEKFRSPYQSIEVLTSPRVGPTLFIDGDLQLSQWDEFIYHEALAHLPLAYVSDRPHANVLIIGGGDGGVCARALQHDWVASLTLVDIDAEVVGVARRHACSRYSSLPLPTREITNLFLYSPAGHHAFDFTRSSLFSTAPCFPLHPVFINAL